MQKPKLICPACGAEMNQHAFKIEYGTDDRTDDASFEGTLEEVHTCPKCGDTELRKA